jgi:hypothetical protein
MHESSSPMARVDAAADAWGGRRRRRGRRGMRRREWRSGSAQSSDAERVVIEVLTEVCALPTPVPQRR